MQIRVEVTQEHIDAGDCQSPHTCALALAIKPHLRRGVRAYFGSDDVVFLGGYTADGTLRDERAYLTIEGVRFVRRFDAGKSFAKPAIIPIHAPSWAINSEPADEMALAA